MGEDAARICELHALDPGLWGPAIVAQSAMDRPAPAGAEPGPAPRLSPSATASFALAINLCLVREPMRCGCADRRALCHRGGAPTEVKWSDCEACASTR